MVNLRNFFTVAQISKKWLQCPIVICHLFWGDVSKSEKHSDIKSPLNMNLIHLGVLLDTHCLLFAIRYLNNLIPNMYHNHIYYQIAFSDLNATYAVINYKFDPADSMILDDLQSYISQVL